MDNYKKRMQVMAYLTRKPVTPQDIEIAQSRILKPVTPLQVQATSIEKPETDYQTEVAPEMVVPPQDVLPKNAEPVMPWSQGIPNPQARQLELATGGRVKFQNAGLATIKKSLEAILKKGNLKNFEGTTDELAKHAAQYIEDYAGGSRKTAAEQLGYYTSEDNNGFTKALKNKGIDNTKLPALGRTTDAPRFTKEQIDSSISGEAAELKGDKLLNWIKKQDKLENYDDINFYKAIEKYKNEELGGNLFQFWKESGLSRNNIEKSLARRRGFKFTTLGLKSKTEIVKDIDTPYDTVKEMTDAIKRGEFNVQDRINLLTEEGVIEKGKFYNSYDLAKILGVTPDKKEIDKITQFFTTEKKGAYQRGVRGGEDIPFEQGERKNIFKYRPEDIGGNIQKFGEEKVIFGTGNKANEARREFERKIDLDFYNYKQNFKKRRTTLLDSEHPDFVEIAMKRNVDSGLNYDIGHPVPLALIQKHKFLQTPENMKKFHSISDFTIQDDRINRKILVGQDETKELSEKYNVGSKEAGFQKKEDQLLIELNNFLKNKENKKATQEDINFINQWNKKSKELYKEKFETVKDFVNDRKYIEPYLKGQEYTTFGFKFDLKPGQKINGDNLQLDRSYFKNDKSFGNIASVAPDAQRFNDLTPKQKAQFHINVINQYGDYIGDVAKASNIKGKAPAFNKEDIQDLKDTLLYGTNENKGLIDYKNLMYGVGTPFAISTGVNASGYGDEINKEISNIFKKKEINDSENMYSQEIPSLGETDPIGILEQRLLNSKDIDEIYKLLAIINSEKEKIKQEEKVRQEEKTAQKAKGIRYKEDFPSEAAYFAETGKQLLTNPKYFLSKLAKGAIDTNEWLVGQPMKTLFSQEGKNWEFYHPVLAEKLGLNKYIEENIPKGATTGALLGGEAAEIAGTIADPFLAYGLIKGGAKGAKPKGIPSMEEIDPTRRDILKTGAVMGTGAALYPTAKKLGLFEELTKGTEAATAGAKLLPKVTGMPEWFPSLVSRIEKEGKLPFSDYATTDNVKIKELVIPSKTTKGKNETYIMTKYPNGKIEIRSEYGGAYDQPFELHYTPPESFVDETTGKVIKEPGDFSIVEQRPRAVGGPHDADYEFDWDNVSRDQALSDIERIEKTVTGKITNPKEAEARAAQRDYYYNSPYEDIVDRSGDIGLHYDDIAKEEFAKGGRVGFSGGGNPAIKFARMITDLVNSLQQDLSFSSHIEKIYGSEIAKKKIISPYRIPEGTNKSKQSDILMRIDEIKQNLPKEYSGLLKTLDDIEKNVSSYNYISANKKGEGLLDQLPESFNFEKLPLNLFPMEDPLNTAFILFDPKRDKMAGRYIQKYTLDAKTGKGIIETYDAYDPVSKKMLEEKDWKLIGVDARDEGGEITKKGLN